MPSIKESDNELSDENIKTLANCFSINITYYRDEKCEILYADDLVFTTPLVVFEKEDQVGLLYTRSQMHLLVDQRFKKQFSKESMKANMESLIAEKAEATSKKTKVQKLELRIKELEKLKGENEFYKGMMDEFSFLLLDFGERTVSFIEELGQCAKKDEMLEENKNALWEAKILARNEDEFSRQYLPKVNDWKDKLTKRIINNAINNLKGKKAAEKPVNCNQCNKSCNIREVINLSCGHNIDERCLIKYFPISRL